MAVHRSELERVLPWPREVVWPIAADTNRADRALGLAPARYEWVEVPGEGRVRVGTASEMGVKLAWTEPPYAWAEGRFVRGRRLFRSGPARRAGFELTLSDTPDGGTRARASVWVEGPIWLGAVQRAKWALTLPRYFDWISQLLEASGQALRTSAVDGTAAMTRARTALGAVYVEGPSGARAPTDAAALASALARLDPRVPRALAERLAAHLRERPDDDVAQMRPFELADRWGEDRIAVLRLFLRAAEAGLVTLSWQVLCPVCRVGASLAPHLGELGRSAHCNACDIDYGVDFARHVEAVFPCAPALRHVTPQLFCASSPAFLPHITAQLVLGPGERLDQPLDLPNGPLLVRALGGPRASVTVPAAEAPGPLRITLKDGSIEARRDVDDGAGSRAVVENLADAERSVVIERVEDRTDAALGTVVASLPEFAGLFALEAPAAGVELEVGFVALLFTDLTGSTALYEALGDARAFALVEAHFRVAEAEIHKHRGVIVKTMGDAVMASFASLDDAVAAALDVVRAHDARFASEGLGIKVGVHGGACLAVRANDRLDYFGTTVNTCARIQAQAGTSEVVLAAKDLADPAVSARVAGLAARPFEAHLKGLADAQALVALTVGPAARAG